MKNSKLKIESYFAMKITQSQMQTIKGGDLEITIDPPIGGGPVSTGGNGSGSVLNVSTTTDLLPTTNNPLIVFVPVVKSNTNTNSNI